MFFLQMFPLNEQLRNIFAGNPDTSLPLKTALHHACARIFWCGMLLRLFLDLGGLVLQNAHGNQLVLSTRPFCKQLALSHSTTVPLLESSGVECFFVYFWIWWPGAPKRKFLLTCIVNTPFFFWQMEFSNDCACERIFWCGMRRRLFLGWLGPQKSTGINSCSMLPLFQATGIVTRDHCVCVRILW